MLRDVLAFYMGGGGSIMGYLVFVVPTIILALWAQSKVSSTYNKYVRVPSRGQITGSRSSSSRYAECWHFQRKDCQSKGHLTDHYDPIGKKELALSEEKTIMERAWLLLAWPLMKRGMRFNTRLAMRP